MLAHRLGAERNGKTGCPCEPWLTGLLRDGGEGHQPLHWELRQGILIKETMTHGT